MSCFGQYIVVEGVGDVERSDHRQSINPGRSALAQQLGDDAFTLHVRGRVADDLERDLVAGLRSLGTGVSHVDRSVKRGAVDLHISAGALLEIGPHEQARGPCHDLDDPALKVHPGPPGRLMILTTTSSPLEASPAASGAM